VGQHTVIHDYVRNRINYIYLFFDGNIVGQQMENVNIESMKMCGLTKT
jgi:hypothetical protein